MKEIGEYLKQARIHNGVSIEEASDDLDLSVVELENLEDGNIRAFKDVYVLKELVREYGKYLGLETDKIIDEFNDFMFDHTSKISLDDIKEARKLSKELEEKPKVVSPYTYRPSKKVKFKLNLKKILIGLVIVILLILVIFTVKTITRKGNKISNELMGRGVYNELTY